MRNSLTLRLIITSFAWVGVTLLITAVLLIVLFRGHIERHFEAQLGDHLQELVSASEFTAKGVLQMTWRPSDPRFHRPHSGWYWEIIQSGESVARSNSLWRESLKVAAASIDGTLQMQQFFGPEGEPLQALVRGITFPEVEEPLIFVVAGPIADIEDNVRAFAAQVAITLTVLGFGLLLAVWFQVRFGLRPLQALQRALGDIRKGKEQMLPETYPSEVTPVVSELNSLLAHNKALLERARTQVGNLAHALKNPLTVIRLEANRIENSQGRLIREQAATMMNSVDRYLSQARIAGTVCVLGARADVTAIMEDLRFSMVRLYQEKDLEIIIIGPGNCWFRGEAQDLVEMLGNLMDNACKWAHSQVIVRTQCIGDRLQILVEDDGPGITEQQQRDVLERGLRLDEKIPGSGLGLDIVQDITLLYRGSITLGKAFCGGLSVLLDLPATD